MIQSGLAFLDLVSKGSVNVSIKVGKDAFDLKLSNKSIEFHVKSLDILNLLKNRESGGPQLKEIFRELESAKQDVKLYYRNLPLMEVGKKSFTSEVAKLLGII